MILVVVAREFVRHEPRLRSTTPRRRRFSSHADGDGDHRVVSRARESPTRGLDDDQTRVRVNVARRGHRLARGDADVERRRESARARHAFGRRAIRRRARQRAEESSHPLDDDRTTTRARDACGRRRRVRLDAHREKDAFAVPVCPSVFGGGDRTRDETRERERVVIERAFKRRAHRERVRKRRRRVTRGEYKPRASRLDGENLSRAGRPKPSRVRRRFRRARLEISHRRRRGDDVRVRSLKCERARVDVDARERPARGLAREHRVCVAYRWILDVRRQRAQMTHRARETLARDLDVRRDERERPRRGLGVP